MIRAATIEDIPVIVALGSRSLVDGPYAGKIADNPAQTAKTARQVIEGAGKVLLWDEDGVKGLLGFVIYDNYFTGEKTAGEIMWYVVPEERATGAALKLFWAAENEARKLGARILAFTAPNEDVAKIYERFGFKRVEVSYAKEL